MIKQARTKGIQKLKTTVLILALLLCIPLTAASASQIVIEDADTIWNVTSDYPPKLINTTENVTPRVTIEYANTIYHNVLAILTELTNVTNFVTARITAEYANTVYCNDLDKVPAALANLSHTVVSSRLIWLFAISCG
jgi:predicted PurR-regulated permease PerM